MQADQDDLLDELTTWQKQAIAAEQFIQQLKEARSIANDTDFRSTVEELLYGYGAKRPQGN